MMIVNEIMVEQQVHNEGNKDEANEAVLEEVTNDDTIVSTNVSVIETEDEYEVVELIIEPQRIICPDCGGLTLEGLDYCDKCGGEINFQ